jgi:hypothetical protein
MKGGRGGGVINFNCWLYSKLQILLLLHCVDAMWYYQTNQLISKIQKSYFSKK